MSGLIIPTVDGDRHFTINRVAISLIPSNYVELRWSVDGVNDYGIILVGSDFETFYANWNDNKEPYKWLLKELNVEMEIPNDIDQDLF